MRRAYYYADVDDMGVLCVDRLGDGETEWTPESVAALAEHYPDAIYFYVEA